MAKNFLLEFVCFEFTLLNVSFFCFAKSTKMLVDLGGIFLSEGGLGFLGPRILFCDRQFLSISPKPYLFACCFVLGVANLKGQFVKNCAFGETLTKNLEMFSDN